MKISRSARPANETDGGGGTSAGGDAGGGVGGTSTGLIAGVVVGPLVFACLTSHTSADIP